jgi:hypothetical protein
MAVARIAPKLLVRKLAGAHEIWREELPVQATLRIEPNAPFLDLRPEAIKTWCAERNLTLLEGYDAFYLPPPTWENSPLAGFKGNYPDPSGLKISKWPGGSSELYLRPRAGRTVQRRLSYCHLKQLLTFNVLYLEGVAPRLYDLVEIVDSNGRVWTAYVVQHIEDAGPSDAEYERVVGILHSLTDRGLITLINPERWNVNDFRKPDCGGNLVVPCEGRGKYVDIHNFVLDRYGDYLRNLASSVGALSHFGGRSHLLGGRSGAYLYQEIPGVDLPAKRSPRERMRVLDQLAGEAGVEFSGTVVFDVGCNLGLMGAEYLRRGAAWLHGWDKPEVVAAAEKILLAIGCTRFSLGGKFLSDEVDLLGTLPGHLRNLRPSECVVSYLAIRKHIGWIKALRQLPWRYMLYEGHQDDSALEDHVSELNALLPVKVRARGRVADANSWPRDVAIIERA